MILFRKYLIVAMNLLVILSDIKVILFDDTSDGAGLFVLLTIAFLVFYDFYGWLVFVLFAKNENRRVYPEVVFGLLLVLPFLAIVFYPQILLLILRFSMLVLPK